MKQILLIVVSLGVLNFAASAQGNSAPTSPPASANPPAASSGNNSSNQPRANQGSPGSQRSINPKQSLAEMSMNLEILSRVTEDPLRNARSDINKLYRKTNKKDLEKLNFNFQDFTNFAPFLQGKNTGLMKLMPDAGCDRGTSVVVASDDCLKYSFPGAGSAYSFRFADYRSHQLSDLIFTGDSFHSDAVWTQGIFVTIGDVPLEQINLQSPALKYLIDLQPAVEQEKALTFQQQLIKGIKADGFVYSQAVNVRENTTYALRSIAYDGKFHRTVKGFVYDEFDFDKRKDVIVGFRVIRREADGGVTVLWKELSRKNAPKLLLKKEKK